MFLAVFGRRHASELFKGRVEHGFGVEPCAVGDIQDRAFFFLGRDQFLPASCMPRKVRAGADPRYLGAGGAMSAFGAPQSSRGWAPADRPGRRTTWPRPETESPP